MWSHCWVEQKQQMCCYSRLLAILSFSLEKCILWRVCEIKMPSFLQTPGVKPLLCELSFGIRYLSLVVCDYLLWGESCCCLHRLYKVRRQFLVAVKCFLNGCTSWSNYNKCTFIIFSVFITFTYHTHLDSSWTHVLSIALWTHWIIYHWWLLGLLHGNFKHLKNTALKWDVKFYSHCVHLLCVFVICHMITSPAWWFYLFYLIF